MNTKDQKEYEYQNLQEIVLVCMQCGTQNPTGKYTRVQSFDEKYTYSHGFCSIKCAEKQYPDMIFSELESELKTK
jgi:hypothetical protein